MLSSASNRCSLTAWPSSLDVRGSVHHSTVWTQKHSLISSSYKVKTYWDILTKLVGTVAQTHHKFLELMYLQSHIHKNISVSFDFITTWNQGVFLCSPCISHTEIANKMRQCIKIYYSMLMWSSTCFGRHTAHHQELKTALAISGFAYVKGCWPLRLLDADSRSARPRPTALLPPRSNGKLEAATAVIERLMMGMRMPETCWAVFKRKPEKLLHLVSWFIWMFDDARTCKP
jgi:hypothetical protein